jgi:hypothetical protein
MTTETLATAGTASEPMLGRARSTILASALAVGAVAVAAVLLFRPWPERNAFDYDQIAPSRDGIWTGILVDGLGFAVTAVALSLVVCAMARTRGAVWANVGAVVTSLGGIAFAMGAFAFAALAWYATDATVLSEEQGARMLDHVVDNPQHAMVMQMAGFLGYTIGSVLLSVALLRARAVPRAIPVAVLVLTAAQFSGVDERVLDFVQIALMAVLVCIAALFVRNRR